MLYLSAGRAFGDEVGATLPFPVHTPYRGTGQAPRTRFACARPFRRAKGAVPPIPSAPLDSCIRRNDGEMRDTITLVSGQIEA